MADFDYADFTITVLAAEIEEEVERVKNLEKAINDLPGARKRLAFLRAEMLKRVSPQSPQDTDSTETVETVIGQIDPTSEEDRAKYRAAVFADTPAYDGGDPPAEPVEPMADLSGEPWPKFPGSEEIDWGAPNGGLDQVDARTVFEPKS